RPRPRGALGRGAQLRAGGHPGGVLGQRRSLAAHCGRVAHPPQHAALPPGARGAAHGPTDRLGDESSRSGARARDPAHARLGQSLVTPAALRAMVTMLSISKTTLAAKSAVTWPGP